METTIKNGAEREATAYRRALVADLPVKEQQVPAGEIPTAYLEGGEGTPLVMLHGPGESAIWWMRVLPHLVEKYKVIVPDLPGHGASGLSGTKINKPVLVNWLDEFLHKTCNEPPVLIGHVVGGAIAAHYAIQHSKKIKQLILVDTLGLSAFRPAPLFAFGLLRFMMSPTEKNYLLFLPQCLYDVDKIAKGMGNNWQPFLDYYIALAKNPEKKASAKELINAMSGKIPENELEKIHAPVTLIWGRHDKANSLKVALKAHAKYGWPLHIIEETRDDPKLEKPNDFVEAVEISITEPVLEKHE